MKQGNVQSVSAVSTEKKRVAWGVTGSGDKLAETVKVMRKLRDEYEDSVVIWVYLSKAGEHVAKLYLLMDDLRESFPRVFVEVSANVPFLAGDLQLGKFEFLLVAPATSNTVAKIASGIGDSLLSNSAIMALKGCGKVYMMPTDIREGTVTTRLHDGRETRIRVRREDAENVGRLRAMEGVTVLEKPEQIRGVFRKRFGGKGI